MGHQRPCCPPAQGQQARPCVRSSKLRAGMAASWWPPCKQHGREQRYAGFPGEERPPPQEVPGGVCSLQGRPGRCSTPPTIPVPPGVLMEEPGFCELSPALQTVSGVSRAHLAAVAPEDKTVSLTNKLTVQNEEKPWGGVGE